MRIFPAPGKSDKQLFVEAMLAYIEEQKEWVRKVQAMQEAECNKDRCMGMTVMLNRVQIYIKEKND